MNELVKTAKDLTVGALAVIGFITVVTFNVIVTQKFNVKIWKEENHES